MCGTAVSDVAAGDSPACVQLLDLCGRLDFMFRRISSALIFAVLIAWPPISAHAATKPNIVLITLESTRADRMGFLGSKTKITPNLDGLARQSMVFEQAYSQAPLTVVSHATILSGTYPQTHRVSEFGARLALDSAVSSRLAPGPRISHRRLRRLDRTRSKRRIGSRFRPRIQSVRCRISTWATWSGQRRFSRAAGSAGGRSRDRMAGPQREAALLSVGALE